MMREDFLDKLEHDCFVIWSLPNFEQYSLTTTPVVPDFCDYVERENSELQGAYIRAHIDAGLWPVVYEGENNGHLIRHVCPMMTAKDKISSHGAQYDFYPHVDNPDLRITSEEPDPQLGGCPDTLSLICMRQEPSVYTSLLLLDEVIAALDAKTISALKEPQYKISRPASFATAGDVKNVPLLTECAGKFFSRFDWHNVAALTPLAEKALESMRYISLEKQFWRDYCLEPGQVITFLNQRTLHTRNAFTPRFDGTDRWLMRLFCMKRQPDKGQLLDPETCHHNLRTTKG